MTYTLFEGHTSKNYTPSANVAATFGQGPRVIVGITVHHWGSKGQNFWDVENYLCVNNTPTSAHFVVERGLVSCIVSPLDAAWHSGNARGNALTIGLELRPEASNEDYQTAGELIAKLRADFGADLPLFHHRDWFATACPGVYDLARLDRIARTIGTPQPVAQPVKAQPLPAPVKPNAPVAGKFVPDPHWKVDKGDTLAAAAKWAGVTVDRLAKYNGIKDANKIKVGERIWPPVGRDTWIVDPGDTLSAISKFYGGLVKVENIMNANGINDPSKLTVGMRLQIP